MATHIALGFSSENDPVAAFRAAAVMAKSRSGLPRHDLVVLAATPSYAIPGDINTQSAIDALHKVLNPDKLIGLCAPALI